MRAQLYTSFFCFSNTSKSQEFCNGDAKVFLPKVLSLQTQRSNIGAKFLYSQWGYKHRFCWLFAAANGENLILIDRSKIAGTLPSTQTVVTSARRHEDKSSSIAAAASVKMWAIKVRVSHWCGSQPGQWIHITCSAYHTMALSHAPGIMWFSYHALKMFRGFTAKRTAVFL